MHHRPSDWDPRDSSVLDDQRAAYDTMRHRCPVAYSDFLGWSLFRHQDVTTVLDYPGTFSNASRHLQIPNGMDPPEHTRYRQSLEPFFTDTEIMVLEDGFRRLAAGLLVGVETDGTFELMAGFAHPFTLQSLCLFLGWPASDWEFLRGWTHGNQQAAFSRNREAGAALAHHYATYVQQGIDARRQSGIHGDDLTSRLMRIEVDGATLTDEGLVSMTRNWTAGQGTVAAGIGIVTHALATSPELQARLREDPLRIPAAIEEILRVEGPLVANGRTATHDVEIGDRTIRAGERLSLMWISANRDEHAFGHAESVDIDRDQGPNLLYGRGVHYCLGAGLARLEMRIAIEQLLAHTPSLALAATDPLERQVYPSNGYAVLPLTVH